jgi:hypothetical protein
MPKKHRGRCVYCNVAIGSTRDHVPPKSILEQAYPPNLFWVPACAPCNQGFALDEQYFVTILSNIATAPTLANRVSEGGSVDRALTASPRLDQRIVSSLSVRDDGRVMLQPELDRMNRIVAKIAFGLFIRRYGVVPHPEDVSPIGIFPYNLEDHRPPHIFILAYRESFLPKRWVHVQKGVFSYLMVRAGAGNNDLLCLMDIHNTAWAVAKIPNPSLRGRMGSRPHPRQLHLPL